MSASFFSATFKSFSATLIVFLIESTVAETGIELSTLLSLGVLTSSEILVCSPPKLGISNCAVGLSAAAETDIGEASIEPAPAGQI